MSANFSNFGYEAFKATSLVYDESGKQVQASEVSGNISFGKVTIQPAKASMTNSLTKEVEFLTNTTDKKVVFDWTYTAKKGDVELNEFAIYNDYNLTTKGNKVTFYVYVDGDEVNDAKVALDNVVWSEYNGKYVARRTFDKVSVKNGESVNIKVEAEVEGVAVDT